MMKRSWEPIFVFRQALESFLENPSFLDSCTGLQNLKMIADINQKITEKEIRDTLFRVGLDRMTSENIKNILWE